jgi:hypothetical protein
VGADTQHGGGFDAFDAAGVTNCSGEPVVCQPLWTANTGSVDSTAAVAGGLVYVRSVNFTLFAFDAAGVTNCSGTPVVCKAVWTSASPNVTSDPVAVGGVVYAGGFQQLMAFDAAGLTDCANGVPRRCSPLWTGDLTYPFNGLYTSAANGVVYTSTTSGVEQFVDAFDAAGVANCSGTPPVCEPLWSWQSPSGNGSIVIANGVLTVNDSSGTVYNFTAP